MTNDWRLAQSTRLQEFAGWRRRSGSRTYGGDIRLASTVGVGVMLVFPEGQVRV